MSYVQQTFQNGTDKSVDSYSGFFDHRKKNNTGLSTYLNSRSVEQVFIVGLATDYCVKLTALDAVSLGFETTVIIDAVKAVNLHPGDLKKAITAMRQGGIQIKRSDELT